LVEQRFAVFHIYWFGEVLMYDEPFAALIFVAGSNPVPHILFFAQYACTPGTHQAMAVGYIAACRYFYMGSFLVNVPGVTREPLLKPIF
jgi:hypothetical protein